jgi:hypothetical protein
MDITGGIGRQYLPRLKEDSNQIFAVVIETIYISSTSSQCHDEYYKWRFSERMASTIISWISHCNRDLGPSLLSAEPEGSVWGRSTYSGEARQGPQEMAVQCQPECSN